MQYYFQQPAFSQGKNLLCLLINVLALLVEDPSEHFVLN